MQNPDTKLYVDLITSLAHNAGNGILAKFASGYHPNEIMSEGVRLYENIESQLNADLPQVNNLMEIVLTVANEFEAGSPEYIFLAINLLAQTIETYLLFKEDSELTSTNANSPLHPKHCMPIDPELELLTLTPDMACQTAPFLADLCAVLQTLQAELGPIPVCGSTPDSTEL